MPDTEEKAKPEAKADDKKAEKPAEKPAEKAAEKPADDKKDAKPEAKQDKPAEDGKKADDKAGKDDKTADKKDDKNEKGDSKENPDAAGKKGEKGKLKKDPKKKKEKKPKEEKPKVPYIDTPDKPEIPSQYIHKAVKLDKKNNQFSDNAFQKVRKTSNLKRNLEAFHRIATCLNDTDLDTLPTDCINKVCLILMNTYPRDTEKLGVGPSNDAYLMAMIHHKLGYKIAYLINPDMDKFTECLEFFVEKTAFALTIFYSGHDSSSRYNRVGHGIQFVTGERLSSVEFGEIVGGKSNGTSRILIISDVSCGRSIFSMKAAKSTDNAHCSEICTFTIDKSQLSPKERRKSQGLFTYYFCKLIRQFPNSTPQDMVDMLNISFERFKETFSTLVSSDDINDKPLFIGADIAFNGKSAKHKKPQAAAGAAAPAATPDAPAAAPAASPAPANA